MCSVTTGLSVLYKLKPITTGLRKAHDWHAWQSLNHDWLVMEVVELSGQFILQPISLLLFTPVEAAIVNLV